MDLNLTATALVSSLISVTATDWSSLKHRQLFLDARKVETMIIQRTSHDVTQV